VANSEQDQLETLIRDLAAARQAGDHARSEELKQALEAFSSFDSALNDLAHEALVAAAVADLAAAVSQMQAITDGLSGAREALQRSRAAAASGQKNLIIPRIAAAGERMLEEMKTVKAGVDSLIAAGDNVDDMVDLANMLNQALAELQGAIDRAKAMEL